MRRLSALAAGAAICATLAVRATGQTPGPQPSTSGNRPPTIALSTDPAKQVFGTGERFIVTATTSDDADAPDRLQYQWSVRSLDTGVERPARSTALQQVRTLLTEAGKYDIKCVVTDTAGAKAEATLTVAVEDAGHPEVTAVAFDDVTAALHHTAPYKQSGFNAVRRGDWAGFIVSVRNFIAGPHFLKVLVDGKPVAADGAGSGWAVQNLGGTTSERRIRVLVPPDAAVGRHTVEVAAFRRGVDGAADTETSRVALSPEPIVLFNPWRSALPDVSVHAARPLPSSHATFYTSGTQDLLITGAATENINDVTPHDKAVVTLAQEIVTSMPADARGDAARVAAAMAAHAGDTVAILRSIGIPAREITLTSAARALGSERGPVQATYECRRWIGRRCEDSQSGAAQAPLSFRSWTEVWLPSVNAEDGWTVVDGTPKSRSAFLDEATKLPWEILWKGPDNVWFKASGSSAVSSHAFVTMPDFQRSDELRSYGAGPAGQSTLQIAAGPIVNLRSAVTAKLTGTGSAPPRLGVAVVRLPREVKDPANGTPSPGGLAFASVVDSRDASGSGTSTIEIPAEVFSVAGAYEIAVGPPQGSTGPSARARLDVRGLPIAIAAPAQVDAGSTFAVSARLVNSTNAPVNDATLRLILPSQFSLVSGSGSVSQGALPAGAALKADTMVQALAAGSYLIGAASSSSAGPAEAHTRVKAARGARVLIAGEPALGVTIGTPITLTADVLLDAVEVSGQAEAEISPVAGDAISTLGDARKTTDAMEPHARWTPSWQVQVNRPGIYRLPVRAGVAGVGEARGEILVVAGASDPDADLSSDFDEEGSLGYRSVKAMGGVAAAVAALVFGAIYWIRRRA